MTSTVDKLKVGISGCLHGQEVRYDATHRFSAPIFDRLNPFVQWVVVCPEFDSGMGVPRETIYLIGSVDNPRVETTETNIDKTQQLFSHCQSRAEQLATEDIAGFILKARSPSCGKQVGVTLEDGSLDPNGQGVFVAALRKTMPALPIVNEEEIESYEGMEEFVESMKRYKSDAS